VLVNHHPNKGRTRAGQAARGSGARSGHVDILIEMGGSLKAAEDDRRRRLRAWSRYGETPRQFLMELNPEGTQYRALDPGCLRVTAVRREEPLAVLEAAPAKLTLDDVLCSWPAGSAPEPRTLLRWLHREVNDGVVCRDGTGHRNDPYRYWLFGQEERWAANPLRHLVLPEARIPPCDRLRQRKRQCIPKCARKERTSLTYA
jgi:hypothetical protein